VSLAPTCVTRKGSHVLAAEREAAEAGWALANGRIKNPCSEIPSSSFNEARRAEGFAGMCATLNSTGLIKRGRMFEEVWEQASDPISRQHCRAAHHRSLAVEHQETRASPEHEFRAREDAALATAHHVPDDRERHD
jgi:hypothetical protein